MKSYKEENELYESKRVFKRKEGTKLHGKSFMDIVEQLQAANPRPASDWQTVRQYRKIKRRASQPI